jgi:AraC family ethanolamine operon transcriptional activator
VDTRSYTDFDEFAEEVTAFDGRILLNHPNKPKWTISHIDLCGVHIQSSLVGSGSIVEGVSWDGYVVYLPLSGACKKILNGTEIDKHSLLLFEPGSDFFLSSASEHIWCSIFVPIDVWTRAGNPLILSLGGEKGSCRVTRPNRQLAMQGRSLVRDIQFAASTCPQFESTPAATIAAEKAVKFVSRVVGEIPNGEPHRDGRPRISRIEIIRRCKELLDEQEGKPVSVSEMTKIARVSERTLETAFKEYFDEGPRRYMQLRHLKQIHCALRASHIDEKTVTEILTDHEEYEFGRFAGHYHRLYGELPSQTLRAS